VVVATGARTSDPDVPDGEKFPRQAVALALVQVSVVVSGLHNAVGDAERVTVGAAAVAACATAIAGGFADCETAPTLCAGTICSVACPSAVAGGETLVIGVAFAGTLELGDELTACPKATSAEKSKPSLIVKRAARLSLRQLEFDLTRIFMRKLVSGDLL
jgi:hypothetical protein